MNVPFITKELCAILGNPVAAQYATVTGLFPLTLEEFKTIGSKTLAVESIAYNKETQHFIAASKPLEIVQFEVSIQRVDNTWVEIVSRPIGANLVFTHSDGRILPQKGQQENVVKLENGFQHEKELTEDKLICVTSIDGVLLVEHSQ